MISLGTPVWHSSMQQFILSNSFCCTLLLAKKACDLAAPAYLAALSDSISICPTACVALRTKRGCDFFGALAWPFSTPPFLSLTACVTLRFTPREGVISQHLLPSATQQLRSYLPQCLMSTACVEGGDFAAPAALSQVVASWLFDSDLFCLTARFAINFTERGDFCGAIAWYYSTQQFTLSNSWSCAVLRTNGWRDLAAPAVSSHAAAS